MICFPSLLLLLCVSGNGNFDFFPIPDYLQRHGFPVINLRKRPVQEKGIVRPQHVVRAKDDILGFQSPKVSPSVFAYAGVKLYDDPANNIYPMPILSHHRDEVWVGRIRRDESQPKSLNLWIVADNLRKGAATNAIQIMQKLIEKRGKNN